MSDNDSAVLALQIVGFKFYLVLAVFTCIESAIILVVNPFAIYIIAKHKILRRSPTNIFIVSANFADIIYGISLLLYHATVFESLAGRTGIAIGLTNRLVYAFATISMVGSMLTTMFIAIERSIATHRPLKYRQWVTPKRALVVITITWVYLLTVVPGLVLSKYISLPDAKKRTLASNIQEAYPPIVFRFYLSMHIYISLVVSIIAYTCISYAVFKQSKHKALMMGNSKDAKFQRQSLKVTKMSMVLLGLLLLTWAPVAATNMIIRFPDYTTERQKFKVHRSVAHCTVMLLCAYSFLNFIVYAANHSDFKRVIRQVLGMKPSNVVTSELTAQTIDSSKTTQAYQATTTLTEVTG